MSHQFTKRELGKLPKAPSKLKGLWSLIKLPFWWLFKRKGNGK